MDAKKYHKIIGLGSNCEVTWNIRSHFNGVQAYPFDWWMTPFHALLQILDDRFNGLFEEKNIQVPADKKTVIDTKYNLMYHHDFMKDEQGLIVPEQISAQLPKLKDKYAFLADRFMNETKGKKVLFVRNRCGNDPQYLKGDYGDIQPEQCIEIYKRLLPLLPETQFDLLVTNKPGFDAFQYGNSNIFSDSITDYHDSNDYMVSPRGWSEMFERNRIELLK